MAVRAFHTVASPVQDPAPVSLSRAPQRTAQLKRGRCLNGMPGTPPLLRRTGLEIFMPHPAIVDRAEVLQVPVPRIPQDVDEKAPSVA